MRTWSLSPFFRENDILEIRLGELDSVVDVFVICEATQTHMGKPKPLYFDHERFAPWRHKIRYLTCDFPSGLDDWGRENYQREYLGKGLEGLGMDDYVIVADVDEILRAEVVETIKDGKLDVPAHFAFPIHPYRLDWKWDFLEEGGERCSVVRGRNFVWNGEMYEGAQKAIGLSFCRFFDAGYTPFQPVRYCLDHRHYLGEHGWHFTYQGTDEEIWEKTQSIADEWVKQATPDQARTSIETGSDLFGRQDMTARRVPMSDLPRYVQENEAKFSHLLGEKVIA